MKQYYTVEQVAKLLSMHPKTIQRYIREGKLQASKIGKSWCITGHNLSEFVEKTDTCHSGNRICAGDKTIVSSVADIQVYDPEEGNRIVTMLTAALNSRQQEYGRASMHTQYLEYEHKLRVTLYGNVDFMKEIFGILSAVIQSDRRDRKSVV